MYVLHCLKEVCLSYKYILVLSMIKCPLDGIKTPTKRARKAYAKAHSANNFKLIVQPGIGHEMTSLMVKEASDWWTGSSSSNIFSVQKRTFENKRKRLWMLRFKSRILS